MQHLRDVERFEDRGRCPLADGSIPPFEGAADVMAQLRPLVGRTGGGTRLYETLRKAVERLRLDWKRRTINAVVLLRAGT